MHRLEPVCLLEVGSGMAICRSNENGPSDGPVEPKAGHFVIPVGMDYFSVLSWLLVRLVSCVSPFTVIVDAGIVTTRPS